MKKKIKKAKIDTVAERIKELEEKNSTLEYNLNNRVQDLAHYKRVVQSIINLFGERNYDKLSDQNVCIEVQKLLIYRISNEGAIRAERETIDTLTEIIRWKINPQTAVQKRENINLDGGAGPYHRRNC